VVNPWVTDFKLYDEWMHPVGLYFLMDLLTLNGIEVHYFNCLERGEAKTATKKYGTAGFHSRETKRPPVFKGFKRKYKRYGCSEKRFAEYLRNLPKVDAVYVGSMMTYWADGVAATVRCIRRLLPEVPVVCGGIAVRLFPGYFRREIPGILLFEGDLFSGSGKIALPGIDRTLTVPETPSLVPGLRQAKHHPHGPLLLTFGCPLRCAYCASHLLQASCRTRPLHMVLEELIFLAEACSVVDYAVYDDALLVNANECLVPFLGRVIERRCRIRLHTPNGLHLKYLTAPLLELMRRVGFTTLRFGYESGAFKNRARTGGKADRRLLEEKLGLFCEFDFPDTGVYVMGGLPDSPPEEMVEEMRFVAGCGAKVKPVFLSPVPGTELFAYYSRQFPELQTDPNWHNDTFFITRLPGWGADSVEMIRSCAKDLNTSLEKPED
jgi:radical SAM superfamily enzyme YgiQ (UPF0313 family)